MQTLLAGDIDRSCLKNIISYLIKMAIRECSIVAVVMAMLLLPHTAAQTGSYRRIVVARGEVTGSLVTGYFGIVNTPCFLVPLFDFATNERIGVLYDCLSELTVDPNCVGGSNVTSIFNFTINEEEVVFRT